MQNKIISGYWSLMSALFAMITLFMILSGLTMATLLFTDIETTVLLTNLYLIFVAMPTVPNILLPLVAVMLGFISVQKKEIISTEQKITQTILITAILVLEVYAFYSFKLIADIMLGVVIVVWIVLNALVIKHSKKDIELTKKGMIPPFIGAVFGVIFTVCFYLALL